MAFPSPGAARAAYTAATGMPVPPHSMARSAVLGRKVAKGVRKYRSGLAVGAIGIGALAAGTHGARRRPGSPAGVKTRGYPTGIYKH